MIDEVFMIVLDPVYRPEKTPANFERKYELIYSEGIISNFDYIKHGRFKINHRRNFDQHYPKVKKSEVHVTYKMKGQQPQKQLFNFYAPGAF